MKWTQTLTKTNTLRYADHNFILVIYFDTRSSFYSTIFIIAKNTMKQWNINNNIQLNWCCKLFVIISILTFSFLYHVRSIIQTNWTKLEDLIKQVASKVPVQIHSPQHFNTYSLLLPMTVNKKSDWCEKIKKGGVPGQSEKSLCSELKIEHLKPNCCLETQIAGN